MSSDKPGGSLSYACALRIPYSRKCAESRAHLKQVSHAVYTQLYKKAWLSIHNYDFCLTLAYSHRYPAHKGNTFLQLQIFIRVCR